jgi:hypothetical protein
MALAWVKILNIFRGYLLDLSQYDCWVSAVVKKYWVAQLFKTGWLIKVVMWWDEFILWLIFQSIVSDSDFYSDFHIFQKDNSILPMVWLKEPIFLQIYSKNYLEDPYGHFLFSFSIRLQVWRYLPCKKYD